MNRKLALFFAPFSPLSWSLTQAYLYLKELLVSYGTGNILPTLFPKAFGPSNSKFLLVFHALRVCHRASFSPGHRIILPLKGRIVITKIMNKNKGHRACFCGRAADSAKALKNSISWNLHGDKAIRT